MHDRNPTRLLSERLMRSAAAACVMVGLAVSLAAWRHLATVIDDEALLDFERFGTRVNTTIEERAGGHLLTMAGFRGLFAAGETVDAAEFERHHERLRSSFSHPGQVQVRYLEPRSEGLAVRYAVPPQPAGPQALRPAADAGLAEVLERAAETALPVATAPRNLDEGRGYAVFLAVYARGLPQDSPAQRRQAVRGYVQGVFRTSGMFDDLVAQAQAEGYRVWVEDLGSSRPGDAAARLLESAPPAAALPAGVAAMERRHAFGVGGRTWMVHVERAPVASATEPWPLTVLLGGITLSLAVGAMLLAIAGQFGRASRLARHFSREAEDAARRLAAVIDHSADGIVTLDADGALLSANPAAQRMFGLPEDALQGRLLVDLLDEPARAAARDWLARTLQAGAAAGEREEFALRADGARFPLALAVNAVTGAGPGLRVGTLRDVSERRRIETQMQRLAQQDALTGLPNRLLLQQRLAEAIERARQPGGERVAERVGLVFIDLDRFKTINDTLGHHVGDEVLTEIARRLQAVLRAGDTVARMGGDEFVVVLQQLGSTADAEAVAAKVLAALEPPVHAQGLELSVTVSLGLATWPDMAADAATLMSRADAAMYTAKRGGRNRWAWFDFAGVESMPHRLRLESDLRHAAQRGQLEVYFQPQFDCASGALAGAEALLRWQHPQLGPVSPAEFIELAEETGLIVPIGRWALREALGHAARWPVAVGSAPALRLAVNLSPRQMDGDDVVSMVADALAASGLPADRLELEITESAVVRDAESAARRLGRLAELGVTIAIDDFGVGYSSLSYLRELPVQCLKIDRSFVRPLPQDRSTARLVGAMVAMAHQLGMRVVAEGVESEGQLALMREMGCATAQGYLLGRPMQSARFAELARAGAARDSPDAAQGGG